MTTFEGNLIKIPLMVDVMKRRKYLRLAGLSTIFLTGCGANGDQPGDSTESNIEKLFSEQFAVQAISIDQNYNGSITCVGLDSGNVHFYDRTGNVTRYISPLESSAFVKISEGGKKAIVAWDVDGEIAIIEQNGDDLWRETVPDWWTFQGTPSLSHIVYTTFPQAGTGTIGYVEDNDMNWNLRLSDSVGYDVSIAENGALIAVGGAQYWETEDAVESTGTSAILLFDKRGDKLWEYDTGAGTEADVISIEINVDKDIIVAGLDGGRLIASNLDGEILWEKQELGGWVTMSADGSTIVSPNPSGIVGLNPSGDELWRTESFSALGEYADVSADGERVLLASLSAEEVALFQDGQKRWSHSFGRVGPGYSLAEDGGTWALLFVEDKEDMLEVYTSPSLVSTPLPTRSPTPTQTARPSPTHTKSQIPAVDWSKSYNFGHIQTAIITEDEGILLAGFTNPTDDNDNAWLLKANESGKPIWQKEFGGNEADRARDVVQSNDGGYVFVGESRSFGLGAKDVWLLKVSADGEKEWEKTFGGNKADQGFSLVEGVNGGYLILGTSNSYGPGSGDFWLIKTSESGEKQWTHTFGGERNGSGRAIISTEDGGYALTGWSQSFSPVNKNDGWLIKTDASGSQIWRNRLGGPDHDFARNVIQTEDGGYALVGSTRSFNSDGRNFWLTKTDRDGKMSWGENYGGSGQDRAFSVSEHKDGGFLVAGQSMSYGQNTRNPWLVRTDEMGNKVWSHAFDNQVGNTFTRILDTGEGSFILVGSTGLMKLSY